MSLARAFTQFIKNLLLDISFIINENKISIQLSIENHSIEPFLNENQHYKFVKINCIKKDYPSIDRQPTKFNKTVCFKTNL